MSRACRSGPCSASPRWDDPRRRGRGATPAPAAETQMAGRGVRRLTLARSRAIAQAVVGGAEVRAVLDHLARLTRPGGRAATSSGGGREGVAGPPDIPARVEPPVAIGRKGRPPATCRRSRRNARSATGTRPARYSPVGERVITHAYVAPTSQGAQKRDSPGMQGQATSRDAKTRARNSRDLRARDRALVADREQTAP